MQNYPACKELFDHNLSENRDATLSFFVICRFFKKELTFSKILTGIPSECQYVLLDLGLNCLQSEKPMTRRWLTH